MNRRSILGVLGMGAVAGPSIAQEAVNQIGTQGSVSSSGFLGYRDDGKYDNHIYSLSTRDPMKDWQEKLSHLTNDRAKWIADRIAEELGDYHMGYGNIHYNNIDPDIRNMKSITESAKMRMYLERRVKRQYESQKTSLMNQIAGYMGVK